MTRRFSTNLTALALVLASPAMADPVVAPQVAGRYVLIGGDIVDYDRVVTPFSGYLASDRPVDLMENALNENKAQLVQMKEKLGVAAKVEIRSGAAAREILAAAQEHEADLIIVASHTPDISNYFIGATADRVVRHAKCSVLVDR